MREKTRAGFSVDREAEFTLIVLYGIAGLFSDSAIRRAGIKTQLVQEGLDSAVLSALTGIGGAAGVVGSGMAAAGSGAGSGGLARPGVGARGIFCEIKCDTCAFALAR